MNTEAKRSFERNIDLLKWTTKRPGILHVPMHFDVIDQNAIKWNG